MVDLGIERIATLRAATGLVLALLLVGCGESGDQDAADSAVVAAAHGAASVNTSEDPDAGIFQSAAGYYLAAKQAENDGDRATAAKYMSEALKRDPDNVDFLRETFQLVLGEGQFEEADRLAHRLVVALPDNQLANVMLALEDAKAGQFAAAEMRMSQMPRVGLGSVTAPLLLAWALEGEGNTDAALKALDQLSSVRGFGVLSDFHAGFINDVAGRTAAAEAAYKKAIESESNPSFRVVDAFANFYARQGRFEEAEALFRRYSAGAPDTVRIELTLKALQSGEKPKPEVADAKRGMGEAMFDLGSALRQDASARLALQYIRLSVFMAPDFTVAKLTLADTLAADDRNDEALALYREIQPEDPLYFSAQLRIADVLRQMDKLDDAVAELEAIGKKWPDRAEPYATEGDFLRSAERFSDAVTAYDMAIARLGTPNASDWSLYYARGIALERSGQWPRAEADFLKSLELSPDQPSVLNYLGYSWVDRGENLDRAKGMIEHAVQLRPDDGYIVDSLGWVLYREGDYQRAVTHLERAVELRPEDPVINDHLGDAYWRVGRYNEAQFQWRRALSLKPEPDLVGQIGAKLDHGLNDAGKPGEHNS
ncbi:MAG TPA: tetratricopeptide repeat protein [Alphaproteobacteria bacterium]|nr:tetratricopeptide repeat protein [Alphaproteobacteria bacterium]